MQKLTKEQAAVIGAYTGVLCGKFTDMHEYIEKIMGRSIFTHEMANENLVKQIAEKSKTDFLELCAE